jgi:hypothetical protein
MVVNIEGGIAGIARQVPTLKALFFPAGAHPLMKSRPEEFCAEVACFLGKINLQGEKQRGMLCMELRGKTFNPAQK